MATMLGNSALVAYPGHVLLMNWSDKYRLFLVAYEQAVGGFLLVRLGSNLTDSRYVHEGR